MARGKYELLNNQINLMRLSAAIFIDLIEARERYDAENDFASIVAAPCP